MEVTPIDGGYQVKTKFTIESEGGTKPACRDRVAEPLPALTPAARARCRQLRAVDA